MTREADSFEEGFQYALHVLRELGVDVDKLLEDARKNSEHKREHKTSCMQYVCTCDVE